MIAEKFEIKRDLEQQGQLQLFGAYYEEETYKNRYNYVRQKSRYNW